MNRLFLVFFTIGLIGYGSCDEDKHSEHRIQLIAKLCQSMPGESPICKRFADPIETVFTKNSIYHYRSERDDSESLLPKRVDHLTPEEKIVKRTKRQFFYPPMMMPMGYGMFPPLLSISSSRGGYHGGLFGGGFGGSNFQMTLGR